MIRKESKPKIQNILNSIKMQNQAAVEALYSATFVEDYLDCVENLPNDLQRHLSRLREFDLTQYSVSNLNL